MNTVFSQLDKGTSLAPFFVKDSFDVTGRTAMAYKESGKHEAREKFIEEFGTTLFWLGGIPSLRWVSDKFIAPRLGINPHIHYKRINAGRNDKLELTARTAQSYTDEQIVKMTKDYLQKKSPKALSKIEKLNPQELIKKYSRYHKISTAAAVGISFFMLTVALPKFNQGLSKKIINEEANNNSSEQKTDKAPQQPIQKQAYIPPFLHNSPTNSTVKNDVFDKFKQPHGNVAFKGGIKDFFNVKDLLNLTKMAEGAQLSPVNSMLLLDYGIAGSRVGFVPRDNNERIEYAVKEAGIILFFYQAADWIKQGLLKVAEHKLGCPVDLDYKILGDSEFADTLKTKPVKDKLLHFAEKTDEETIINLIDKDLKKAAATAKKDDIFSNFTLKMAQKAGLIEVQYDDQLKQWTRHTEKFIETDKIADLHKNLQKFCDKALTANNAEEFIAKARKVKAAAVVGNIAICCATLSFFLPKLQYFIREKRTGTNAAPGILVYQDQANKNKTDKKQPAA